jgi:hypothetical protein
LRRETHPPTPSEKGRKKRRLRRMVNMQTNCAEDLDVMNSRRVKAEASQVRAVLLINHRRGVSRKFYINGKRRNGDNK